MLGRAWVGKRCLNAVGYDEVFGFFPLKKKTLWKMKPLRLPHSFLKWVAHTLPAILMVQWNMGSWKMTLVFKWAIFRFHGRKGTNYSHHHRQKEWELLKPNGVLMFPCAGILVRGIRVFLSVLEVISLGGGFTTIC